MLNLTLDDIQAALESILADPPSSAFVQDQHTGSIGLVTEDLGSGLNTSGKLVRLLHVKVQKPASKRHHKLNDCVIWEDPLPCGL